MHTHKLMLNTCREADYCVHESTHTRLSARKPTHTLTFNPKWSVGSKARANRGVPAIMTCVQ